MLGIGLGFAAWRRSGPDEPQPSLSPPEALFAAGEGGVWFDPGDLGSLFQERTGAAATTPAEVGGPVGTMLDKSGNGRHATAPSDAARPILRQSGDVYRLEFDGTDDALAFDGSALVGSAYFGAISFTARTSPAGGDRWALGGSTAGQANQNLHIGWPGNVNQLRHDQWGNALTWTSTGIWDAHPRVVAAHLRAAGRELRVDGEQRATSATTTQLSAWAGAALGRRTNTCYPVDIYGLILRAAETDAELAADAEAWLAARSWALAGGVWDDDALWSDIAIWRDD